MGTGGMLIIIVRPESQKANVRVIWARVTFQARRPGAVTSWGDTIGPVPFRWRRPRWWRGPPMMRAPWAGRRWWLTAPGRSTGPPMMRRWPPLWQLGGTPASLLVMPALVDQREGAGLLLYLRWGEGEWDELRRRGPGEGDCQGRRGRVERCQPSDELLSSETSRRSHRERLAGGDIRRVGEEESGDDGGRLTLARVWSAEDLSWDPLWRRVLLPARFEPVLCWARDASRSSEGLSCCSASGPMFSWETEGPTVDWGGASPTNCFQQFLMSSINSSFQPRTISGVGPWESVPASCGVCGRAAMFTLEDDAVGIRGRGPWKKSSKARGGGEVFFSTEVGIEGGGTGAGPTAGVPAGRPEGPGRPGGPVRSIVGSGPRTMVTSTAGPRPGHTQGEGGGA